MSDDLIAGAKWTLENAAGMTLENEEVRQLCDMADRIEALEAKLAKALQTLKDMRDDKVGFRHEKFFRRRAAAVYAELTGGNDE